MTTGRKPSTRPASAISRLTPRTLAPHVTAMTYPAYKAIVDAAAVRPALWRLLIGFVTVFVFMALWIVGLIALVGFVRGEGFIQSVETSLSLETQSPVTTVTYLALVWGLGIGTFIAARFWQKRTLRSLTGQFSTTLHHFLMASLTTFTVISALSLIALPFSEAPTLNMDTTLWAVWLPLGLVAVAGQTLSEELLFRGYIQSQLAARFARPMIWMVVPAVLFGFAHYLPTLPTSAALGYVLIAGFFALLASDLTARTGSIGAAWGFHFSNNAMAILFVASEGSLTGLGLFRTPSPVSDQVELSPFILIDVAVLFGIYLLIRRIVCR